MSFFGIAVIVPEAKQAQALALNQQKSFRQMNIPDLTDNELNIDPDVEAIFQEMTGIRFEAD